MNRRDLLNMTPLGLLALCSGCKNGDRGDSHVHMHDEIERLPLSDEELRKEIEHSPSTEIERVSQKISDTIKLVHSEKMSENFPNWIAFHAVLMYPDTYLDYQNGTNKDENVKRIYETILNSNTKENGPFVLRGGLPYPRHSGPYFMQEHHPDQFLHYFSMGGGTLDAPLTVDGKEFTMGDVLKRSMLEARTSSELAYTVLVYARFLEPGRKWQNKFGETMSLAILLKKLLATPERTCLGTHRLSALARVYARTELREDKKIRKLWPELERQVFEALVGLKRSQRPDGGFTPPGMTPATQTPELVDIYYTGHAMEWLSFLGDEYMSDDWAVLAFRYLCAAIKKTYAQTFRNMGVIGNELTHFDFDGLCHAMSALSEFMKLLDNMSYVLRVRHVAECFQ